MENLLNSTDIATLFLDEALLVRRFTTQAASIIKLIPGDVGRPITDIVTDLDYPRLADDIRGVLKKTAFVEKQIATRDQRWFTVRIMPYRTQDNHIDGVVITFADITVSKTLEAALRKAQSNLKERFTNQTVAFVKAKKNLRTRSAKT
jgi:two-component system CheB/CheR fusion protein